MAGAAGGGGCYEAPDYNEDMNIPVDPVADSQQSIDIKDRDVPKMPKRRPKTFERSFASHKMAKHWHPNRNGDITPRDVFKGSHYKAWFHCSKCNHDFECSIHNVIKGKWCPYCSNKKLCDDSDCTQCFEKSFASHSMAEQWNYTRNDDITPRYVFKNSHNKYWFHCPDCNHDFENTLGKISSSGRRCQYCSNRKLCDDSDCTQCFEKSFASHSMAEQWNYTRNGNKKPRYMFKSANTKMWFRCKDCNHDVHMSLNSISSRNAKCHYCCIPSKMLCKNDDCSHCHERSFASHSKAKHCHPTRNGDINPRYMFKSANRKLWFLCQDCGLDFHAKVCNITSTGNHWCPHCVNKTEKKLFTWLKALCSEWKAQFRADWCRNTKTGKYLPFDFVHHRHKLILELDGRQHFKQTSNWQSPEDTQARDHYKMTCAINKGYKVIRILQEPVLKDSIDWQNELLTTFSLSQIEDSPKVFYLGDDTCKSYNCYKKST